MAVIDIRPETPFHASAVAFGPRGLLILGASGTGKSTTALELCAHGADLVADDRVEVTPSPGDDDRLLMRPHATLPGLVEARGVGLIVLPWREAILTAVLDLDRTETARLPERHDIVILGRRYPLLYRVESPAFPAMLTAFLKGQRHAP